MTYSTAQAGVLAHSPLLCVFFQKQGSSFVGDPTHMTNTQHQKSKSGTHAQPQQHAFKNQHL
jgi:hypothetical protein